jgi:hypothetical protein
VIFHYSGSAPFSFFDDCTGEVIAGIVAFNGIITQTTTSSGQNHFNNHETDLGYATGLTSGIQYVGPSTFHDSATGTNTFPFEETVTPPQIFVSKGGTSNLRVSITMHETFNANGVVTAEVSNTTVVCQ